MKIIGTGHSSPALKITNKMLEQILDTSNEWIVERTGITERRVLSNEELEDLATTAAQNAIVNANLKPEEIDYLICSNVAYEYVTPSLSCIIAGTINSNCPSVDINAACTGFIYALDLAESLLKTNRANNILIVCAEQPTKMVDWNDRSTCVLFGDGAGAVVVTQGSKLKSIKVSVKSNTDILKHAVALEPTPYSQNTKDFPLEMNGREVFKTAITSSLSDIKYVMNEASITIDNIDYYIMHQANMRIIESVRQHLGEAEVKFPHNVEKYGNTSSASIPILLDELNRNNRLKRGNKLILSAFGAGFTSGACLLEW